MLNWKEWLPFEGDKFTFPRLKRLQLDKCPKLKGHLPSHLSFIETVRIIESDGLLTTMSTLHWLSSVKALFIEGKLDSEGDTNRTRQCDMMFSLPKMILNSTFLHELELRRIPSLTAFPEDGLPPSLKLLRIVDCENFTFMPLKKSSNHTSLVTLNLENSCDALTYFPLDDFPALQELYIKNCKSLESIFISETSSHHPSMLQKLSLIRCEALISLPQRMETLTTLEELIISHCDALRSLPGLDTLTSLKRLSLWGPQELMLSFSEGPCLPSNLQSIYIESTRITMPHMTEWGLQRLNALSRLTIRGESGDIVNTLLKVPLLPISLVDLSIGNLSGIKSLEGSGLRHLSSLENLTFSTCSELESSSKDMFPSTLKSLNFYDCSALESLSEDTLPSSLKLLSIWRCPLLEARYENKEHWSHIAHIPVIDINGKLTM